jgi:hypothetical protein
MRFYIKGRVDLPVESSDEAMDWLSGDEWDFEMVDPWRDSYVDKR